MRSGIRAGDMKKAFFKGLVQNINRQGFYGIRTALQKEI